MNSSNGLTLKIVAHYPREDNPNKGTLHVLWEEGQIELRGCPYWLKEYRVYLPGHKVKDNQGKLVHYPAISFVSRPLQKAFQLQLRASWRAYAKEKGLRFKQLSPAATKSTPKGPTPKRPERTSISRPAAQTPGAVKPKGYRQPRPVSDFKNWRDPPRKPQW